jgi:hypothetical protein
VTGLFEALLEWKLIIVQRGSESSGDGSVITKVSLQRVESTFGFVRNGFPMVALHGRHHLQKGCMGTCGAHDFEPFTKRGFRDGFGWQLGMKDAEYLPDPMVVSFSQ